jgi:predicted dehydrogenase
MSRQSRREFLEQSMLAAAAATAAGSFGSLAGRAFAAEANRSESKSPNEKLGVAVVGIGGRGTGSHLSFFSGRDDVEVLWLVDPDEKRGNAPVASVTKKQGRAPKFTRDMREAFADPAVDIVSIATPHHWHSLAAIWAMQAGKDVYVEKPVSHNVSEGRRCIEVARKYNKICQTGTQCRSMPGMREAIEYLHAGNMGNIKVGRGLCYKERKSIGPSGTYTPPASVDYGLWLGPAPLADLTRKQFHYDWHWQWPYGNGDLGNQGVHQMDIARWGLGLNELPGSLISYGGRVGYSPPDAGETPNTQIVMFDYGPKTLTFEVRGLETGPLKHAMVGVIFESDDGRTMVIPSYYSAVVYDKDGKQIKEFTGSGDEKIHFANFLSAVRSRKEEELNASIQEGHLSAALCHLGNISYVLGDQKNLDEIKKELPALGGVAQETFERTKEHLDSNDIDLKAKLQLGALLKFDSAAEQFPGNPAANALLTRPYREPFIVPTADKI